MAKNPTERFSGLAETYASYRPSYPSDAIDFIIAMAGLQAGSLVIDVGCGTGISSRLFAERGLIVCGLEPNEDMRNKAEESLQYLRRHGQAAGLAFCNGSAEDTHVTDASADLVLSAQAFHWFDPDKALPEFRRILKIKGWVALMWNERDESDEFTHKYGELFRTVRETEGVEGPRQKAGNALLESTLFADGQRDLFSSSQILDEDGVVGRAFSASYAPKQDPQRTQFEKSLRALFRQYASVLQAGAPPQVVMHYATSVYTAQRIN